MWWFTALWLGATVGALIGWVVCAMTTRSSIEIDNLHLRRRVADLESGREIAVSRAYELGKRDKPV
jgi:hypothetical protein